MAFTRYKYDNCRNEKYLEEATGIGRYMLNKPGNGNSPMFINDPQIRVQGWGANLRGVINGHPIDIENELFNKNNKYKKYDLTYKNRINIKNNSYKISYPEHTQEVTQQSRVTHPAWAYRTLEHNNMDYLFLNPQENVCMHFHNNLNTRIIERDNYVAKMPCPLNQ